MFDHIPVGVGSKGIIPMNANDLEEALEMGMDWSLREGTCIINKMNNCNNFQIDRLRVGRRQRTL